MNDSKITVKIDFDEEKFLELIREFKKQHPNFIEVIRCKDCEYFYNENDDYGFCENIGIEMEANGYCSDGDRYETD